MYTYMRRKIIPQLPPLSFRRALPRIAIFDNEEKMSKGVSKLDTIACVRERLYSPSKAALMSYAPKVNLFILSKVDGEPPSMQFPDENLA